MVKGFKYSGKRIALFLPLGSPEIEKFYKEK